MKLPARLFAAAFALTSLAALPLPAAERPNILFIVSEDNSEQIGCYGDTRVHTPHLDALAAGGVRYDRAYVPYSVCSPSRAAFLTGLYPRQTGHIGLATHRFAFHREFKTMPAYLRAAGYHTGFIGKTHVNPESVVEDHLDFRGVKHANFNNTFGIADYAREAATVFQGAADAGKPFLCIINYSDAHRRFIGRTKAGYPTVQVTGDVEPLPWTGVDTPQLREETRNYLNCMNRLDEGIGMVLAELEKRGQRENTLIVYLADHGGDFMRGKTTCYEGGVKVPMIANHPGSFPRGHAEPALVSSLDILPTVLHAAQIPVPAELAGTPLQKLQNPRTPRRRYIHTFNTGSAAPLLYLTFGIRDERHKLIHNPVRDRNLAAVSRYKNSRVPEKLWRPDYVHPPEFELYDLHTDPHELTNLAGMPEHHATKQRLFQAMRDFQKRIDDPFLDSGNVDFFVREQKDPKRQPKKRSQETWSHLKKFWPRPAKKAANNGAPEPEGVARLSRKQAVGRGWKDVREELPTADRLIPARVFQDHMVLPADREFPVWGQAKPGAAVRVEFKGKQQNGIADRNGKWSVVLGPFPPSTKSADLRINGQTIRDVLVGLIHNAIGGTPMESWIPEKTLLASDELRSLVTVPWTDEKHPRYPKWCGLRGRQNLRHYFDLPDGPLPAHPFQPGFLFDAGIAPFTRLPVDGIVWYQGESNATEDGAGSPAVDPAWNRRLFTTLIGSWREAWGNARLPFVFAQLPGLNRDWPLFREMQLQVAEADPHTRMAVTIDVGHPTNVHPADKEPVGQRLADLASGVGNRPATREISPTTITFDRAVRTKDGNPPRGFFLAGTDRIFHPARATLRDELTVTLESEAVRKPQAVRYGWANDPKLNLVAKANGHPVSPFRSDTWPMAAATDTRNQQPASPGFTGFETPAAGDFTRLEFAGLRWRAPKGHAAIRSTLAKSGRQCLQLKGGKHSELILELGEALADRKFDRLSFAAERWTRRTPFKFRIETERDGRWVEIYHGDTKVKVGRAYLNDVDVPLPANARKFRFTAASPPNTGVLIDDLRFVSAKPMEITRVRVRQDTAPVLIGQTNSPLLHLVIETEGSRQPLRATGFQFRITEGSSAIRRTEFAGLNGGAGPRLAFEKSVTLKPGENVITLGCDLKPDTNIDGFITAECTAVQFGNGKTARLDGPTKVRRKLGVALRQRGQDGINSYRIPGITTTKAGTLIAVYDNRIRNRGDLPGDIDVGMSRSTDGGQSWEPMKVIMDMGDDPKWNYDGIGDPSILTDRVNGNIWVAATWSHGNRSWRGSGPGMKPEETGQFMLAKSADDGRTWSAPINITSQVKTNPNWRFVLQGPGNGITLRDGTLVFPAQFRGVDDEPVNGKPFSTIISSRDRGETWTIGTGVKIDTTEAQVVQLADGSVMINCRDNRGGSRSVYTTTDLGRTWREHPTTRKALREPVCNAGLLRIEHDKLGPLLIFSNPDTTRGRHHFTLKVSRDEGMTWPAKWHTLYDERPGGGYSVITPVGADRVGVLYEGPGELYFLRFALEELLQN